MGLYLEQVGAEVIFQMAFHPPAQRCGPTAGIHERRITYSVHNRSELPVHPGRHARPRDPVSPRPDEWLWGWDHTPGIVSVHATVDGRALVWRRIVETDALVCEEERFRPWLLLEHVDDLRHLGPRLGRDDDPSVRVRHRELDGPGALRHLVSGDHPAYTVTRADAGCFELTLGYVYPSPPYGLSARFCFDAATGAPMQVRVDQGEGVVDDTVTTSVRTDVGPADLVVGDIGRLPEPS